MVERGKALRAGKALERDGTRYPVPRTRYTVPRPEPYRFPTISYGACFGSTLE
jgi:hypothetical protein